jgi:hypothetical protein
VAQSMAATCHPFIGLKLMSLEGVDPATSGQVQRLGKEPPIGIPPVVPCYIYGAIYIYIYVCICVWSGARPGWGLAPALGRTICYI